MRTVVLGPPSAELERIIARRRALGLDTYDEVWEGDYHMAPAPNVRHGMIQHQVVVLLDPLASQAGLVGTGPFNLGTQDDFRVPDHGWLRIETSDVWVATAALVVEIESPDDETWQKLPFYASHGVDEVVIVSPESRLISWLALGGGDFVEIDQSRLIDSGAADLAAAIDWPPTK